MDDIEARLRVRLERLAAAVPVRSSHQVVVERVRPSAALVRPPSATLLVAAVLVAVVAVGVGLASRLAAPATSDGPSAIAPASSPTGSTSPVPTTSATTPVVLPVNAPLAPTDCGWSATTPLAFAAYATVGDLDAGQIIQGSPNEHVYALVTRDPVELHPMIGSPMLERGLCALRQDGSQTESAVGADWNFNGMQQNPMVTCEGTVTSCVPATLVILDAVASVGHPATRITFRSDEMCIGAPFGGRPCAADAWPLGTQRMTSAVVTFSETQQQAFLNLFWRADGSMISADMMALEAPPPGATPFP